MNHGLPLCTERDNHSSSDSILPGPASVDTAAVFTGPGRPAANMLPFPPQVESLLLSHEFEEPFNFHFELRPVDWCLLSSIGCRWVGATGQPFALARVSMSSPCGWWSLLSSPYPLLFWFWCPFRSSDGEAPSRICALHCPVACRLV